LTIRLIWSLFSPRALARDADLLITESSLKPGQRLENWGHLDPREAAEIAKQAEVKQLLLTHFDAGNYVSLEDRREAEAAAKEIFKKLFAHMMILKLNFEFFRVTISSV
jgi:ribonuclease BN (tRNA processing enzyme)